MKQALVASAFALAILPLGAWAQDKAPQDKPAKVSDSNEITLRGCVVPGQAKDTFVLTHVTEVAPAAGSAMPADAHGRKVVFWLDEKDNILKHANHGVEVKGKIEGFKDSEIELKAGPHPEGGLVAEFEGPGKDVRVANNEVAGAIGTSGRTASEKNDIKTMLVKVDVKDVKAVDYSCRDQQAQ